MRMDSDFMSFKLVKAGRPRFAKRANH
jgi:hypothetical protein